MIAPPRPMRRGSLLDGAEQRLMMLVHPALVERPQLSN